MTSSLCRIVLTCVTCGAAIATTLNSVEGAVMKPGDIVGITVVDDSEQIVLVDPATAKKTVLSSNAVGIGPEINAINLTIDPVGTIFTAGGLNGVAQVLRVDPTTGNRTSLYDQIDGQPTAGTGPLINIPIGILVESDGGVVVAGIDSVVRIDPVTLDRIIVSDSTHGSGPWNVDGLHVGMALDPNGNIILASYDYSEIIRIDRTTGDREIVSSLSVGSGPALFGPTGLAVAQDGTIFVGSDNPAVFRIDPLTGDRTKLAGGNEFGASIYGLALDLHGNVIFKDQYDLFSVDSTGEMISYIAPLGSATGIAIVPATVPEPTTLALSAIGALALLTYRLRRGRKHQ